MPELTNQEKIAIMELAQRPMGGVKANIIELYQSMIKAITASEDIEEKKQAFRAEL